MAELRLLLRRLLPAEVHPPGPGVPARLPGLRRRLHRLRGVHQLRRRAQLHQAGRRRRAPGAERAARRRLAAYPLAVVSDGRQPRLRRSSDGQAQVGTAESPLQPCGRRACRRTASSSRAGLPGPGRRTILARQGEITPLRVPVSDDPNDGSIRTQDARTGYVYTPILVYDDAAGTMTDTATGVVYAPERQRQFEASDGTTLRVGWRVTVGLNNFVTAFGDPRYATPFLKILVWTFAFALLSVVTTFLLGPVLRHGLQRPPHAGAQGLPDAPDPAVRDPRVPRRPAVVRHAEPALRLHQRGAAEAAQRSPGSPTRGSPSSPSCCVNLWLGFPYMFLITTGALQSIPGDILEAAQIDGAGRCGPGGRSSCRCSWSRRRRCSSRRSPSTSTTSPSSTC